MDDKFNDVLFYSMNSCCFNESWSESSKTRAELLWSCCSKWISRSTDGILEWMINSMMFSSIPWIHVVSMRAGVIDEVDIGRRDRSSCGNSCSEWISKSTDWILEWMINSMMFSSTPQTHGISMRIGSIDEVDVADAERNSCESVAVGRIRNLM